MIKKLLLGSLLAIALQGHAEEGMWPLNQLPVKDIAEKYEVTLSPQWVAHVQGAALRVSAGGSASFVSPDGLFLTNHHVGSKAIYHLSTPQENFMDTGFVASRLQEERRCPNMYVDRLVSIEDIAEKVQEKITPTMNALERETARKKAIAEIQESARQKSGLVAEVVSFYEGARIALYLYERYDDVRLVMAPETAVAFFGGDEANFEYPRYALDFAFFRVYKEGKPLQVDNYLKWSQLGPQADEPLFVMGNPGKTRRLYTAAHLEFLRDQEFALLFNCLKAKQQEIHQFAQESSEHRRIAEPDIFVCENGLKVIGPLYQDLIAGTLIQKKRNAQPTEAERRLSDALKGAYSYYPEYFFLEGSGWGYCKLYAWAKSLLRLAQERNKPNQERLSEYREAELPALKESLLSSEPIYPALEKSRLESAFKRMQSHLGASHPVVVAVLQGKSIQARANELIDGSELFDLSKREALYDNLQAVLESQDPLILLAKALDPLARNVRHRKESELDGVIKESYQQIVGALFEKQGTSLYPDATFTLRLAFGSMQGYEGLAPMTTFSGLFSAAQSHRGEKDWELPERWLQKEAAINSSTPLNFVTTCDIVGGNSGSPVVNKEGELVGLIFDGNQSSVLWNFNYEMDKGRSIAVHSEAIKEALVKVYGAHSLVKELGFSQ